MHSFFDRIAASAARDSSSLMWPVMPPVALMMALTMARLPGTREACLSGSYRSKPASPTFAKRMYKSVIFARQS